MSNGRLLRQLIKSGVEGDARAFRMLSEEVIREERDKQHHLLANDLEAILYGGPKNINSRLSMAIPEDKERGLPLISVRQPMRTLDDIVLSEANYQTLERLLLEYRRLDTLRSYGLKASDRMLFVGPPGCGKTLAAEIVASELGRPLAVIRLDSVVSSYLGETAANLRKVFDFIGVNPVVALFDEFDALGKERGAPDEHGELKRVVNAVLQMLDDYKGKSLLIAATNHERMLDSAIWRRFDEILEFKPPNAAQIKALLHLKLRAFRRSFEIDGPEVSLLFKGCSFAGIERIVRQAAKSMVLDGREFLDFTDLQFARRRERSRT